MVVEISWIVSRSPSWDEVESLTDKLDEWTEETGIELLVGSLHPEDA